MKYMDNPHCKVTVGNEIYLDRSLIDAEIVLAENAYWTAKITLNNEPDQYLSAIHIGDAVTVQVKDALDTAWDTLFSGSVLIPDFNNGSPKTLLLQCVGKGYPLNMMNCAEEYGTQSRHATLDTLQEILTNADYGVITKYINKYMGGTVDSGYTINTDYVEDITTTNPIPYTVSPYKPVDKYLGDLCELVTALKSGAAGPQWIVDHDAQLRVKTIGATQKGWHQYVGCSQADATLTEGKDFLDADYQILGKQANVVVYYGQWRRPSNGDVDYSQLGVAGTNAQLDDGEQHLVGPDSIKTWTQNNPNGPITIFWPSTKNAVWNLSSFTDFNTPNLNFYIFYDLTLSTDVRVRMCTDDSHYFELTITPPNQEWKHYSIPIGPYFNVQGKEQTAWEDNDGDWEEINWIEFYVSGAEMYDVGNDRYFFCVDGLHFGDAAICRVAREKFPSEGGTLGTAANPIRTKVITDNVGKDDTLAAGTPGTTDTGLMAQLAYAELLRLQKPAQTIKFSTRMVTYALPGQYVYSGAKDWRTRKLVHTVGAGGDRTGWEVTDDLTNSNTRLRYEDINRTYESIRPEWQDKQASSIKTGNLDIRIARLEEAY